SAPTTPLSLTIPRRPSTRLFPYTTLFRSPKLQHEEAGQAGTWRFPGTIPDHLPRRRIHPSQHPDDTLLRRYHWEGAGVDCGSPVDRKSTRLNSSHVKISYAVFCLKTKMTV